ncbi:MAG: chaperone modulator CbpM [Gammaproteobacteria bacterium]
MPRSESKELAGRIFDDGEEITIVELCRYCAVDVVTVEKLVGEGILEPIDGTHEELRFSYASVRRTQTVVRLRRDLGVNLAGAALALDLMDRIENLQAQLRRHHSS